MTLLPVVLLLAIVALVAGLAGWSWLVNRRIEAAVPPDGEFLDVPGARLHYVDRGPRDAPAIVMVHGLLGQLRHFAYALLEPLAKDHRVILVDRPGWGYSTLTGKRPGIAAQAAMIAALLDRLGVEAPVLVGHSMGGAVSLALALDRPERVRGLALVAPYTQPVDEVPPAFAGLAVPAGLRALVGWTLAVPVGVRTGPAKARSVFAPDAVPADFGTRGGGMLSVRPTSFQAGAFEIAVASPEMAQIAARYPGLGVPVAILYGRDENLLDPELHGVRTAAAIPGAALTLVAGGHMLPITHPAETEAWLRAAIAGFPAPNSDK